MTTAESEEETLKPVLDADKIERFAKDFNRYIAQDLVTQTYNERLAQHAGTGVATGLSSRRKAIDAAFTRMYHDGKKRQLAMGTADELNLWLLDRIALIGNPKLKNAARHTPKGGPYLFTGLSDAQRRKLEAVSWNDQAAQADDEDNAYEPWFRHMQNLDLSRGTSTQEQLNAISNDQIMPNASGPRYNPQTERKGQEVKVQEPEIPNVAMTKPPRYSNDRPPSKRQTGFIGPQQQQPPPRQQPIARSDDDIRNVMRQEPMNTTSDPNPQAQQQSYYIEGHYGGLADYFMPNDSQKKKNAEAKSLKALAATSHPSVIFARKYFQEYNHTDPIERQALPMQRELTQRRVTLDTVVSQKMNPRDYELIKVLLDRDALEADLALDPGDDELIDAMESVLERWSRIKLV